MDWTKISWTKMNWTKRRSTGPSTAVTGTANNDSLAYSGGSDHFFRIQRSVSDWIDIGNISCQVLLLLQPMNYVEGNRSHRFHYIAGKITIDVLYALEQCHNGTNNWRLCSGARNYCVT